MIIISRYEEPEGHLAADKENTLLVSKKSLFVNSSTTQTVQVSWNIHGSSNMMDWIGLFNSECRDLSQFLDHRGRGVIGSSQGTISWNLSVSSLPGHIRRIFFAYIEGLTGRVRARSADIPLTARATLHIRDICLRGIRSEQVKFSIGGHSTTVSIGDRLLNTCLPFVNSPLLTVEVLTHRVRIPIKEIEALASNLSISLATGHQNSFTLQITVAIEPETDAMDMSSWMSTAVSPSSSGSSMSQSTSSSSSSQFAAEPLPPLPKGWEACVDRTGRTFYIDHVTKKTTWQRPGMKIKDDTMAIKRYSMARRTVGLSPPPFCSSPAQLFLQREDFVSLLHENPTALSIYNASPLLKHMIHRIRKCGDVCEKFETQKDFVAFVNLFADTTQPLPPNWSASATKPVVFIDHGNKRTSLLDPRLPTTATPDRKRGKSAPPVRRTPVDNNGNVLDIVNRTDEIASLVEKRLPDLAPKIRKKLRLIERLGHLALNRMANDIDLIMAISILEAEDPVVISELEEKLNHFYTSLQRSGYGCGPQKLKLRFSRSQLLRDAFDQILAIDPILLKKARLSISFDDEEGLDYGGPSRELFFLLSRELFNPYYGLFEYTAADKYTVQINSESALVEHHLQWQFELAGRILGLALLHRCLVDTFFSPVFYKTLLELPIEVDDFAEQDPEFYRSLLWLRTNKVDESLGMTFVTTQRLNGKVIEKELLPAGGDLLVTDGNKEEFISLMTKWRAERGVPRQTRALLRGLHQIIDRDFLRVFTPDQLELVLSGSVEINLDDWRSNTEYKGGYHDEHVVIEWFWGTVEQMSNADRLKLLQFVTGTASIPFEGFAMLRGSNGLKKFTIEKWGEECSLPRAHTCFNRLDLPSYPTRHILRAKLFTAINEGINYAIE